MSPATIATSSASKPAARTPPKQTPPKPPQLSGGSSGGGGSGQTGNNKTCNWVFENGEVCGKTFSKSYNLVVHMRMHEDVRPFHCSLCDQTFRQKAHLQRHETTHGIGVKVGENRPNLLSRGVRILNYLIPDPNPELERNGFPKYCHLEPIPRVDLIWI